MMRDFLDHYLGGLILVGAGLGVIAFGVWDRLPGEARSIMITTGIAILTVGAGVFNVERKQKRTEAKMDEALISQARVESKVEANTQITTEAADAAKVAAVRVEDAIVAVTDASAERER